MKIGIYHVVRTTESVRAILHTGTLYSCRFFIDRLYDRTNTDIIQVDEY